VHCDRLDSGAGRAFFRHNLPMYSHSPCSKCAIQEELAVEPKPRKRHHCPEAKAAIKSTLAQNIARKC
jgi:hypothetical protein